MKKIILSLYLFLAFPAITTLLTGCYLYEGAATSYYQSTDYYELAELGNNFVDQIADNLEEGDITAQNIRDQISS